MLIFETLRIFIDRIYRCEIHTRNEILVLNFFDIKSVKHFIENVIMVCFASKKECSFLNTMCQR